MSAQDHNPTSVGDGNRNLPRRLGRRVLLKLLAKGGMGEVYLASTLGLDGAERASVVKTVRRDHLHDGSFVARFLDEARVQAQLSHPGVAQVVEAGSDDDGEPYTVVEHIEGRSLAEVRARAVQLGTRASWPEAVCIALEVAQALAHVHERVGSNGKPLGIVHRDLSPQNVMVGYAGEVKLIDFGTARGENRRCHTVAGVVFAKPGYVAPEIARHEVGDGRIDLYALGVMLWELCQNRRLLDGDAQKHLEQVAENRFVIPKLSAQAGVPAELDLVIEKLTANDPHERFASAAMAASELARLLMKAPNGPDGERSVRARIAAMMKHLFVSEPARSRSEFARLLAEAKTLVSEASTPQSGSFRVDTPQDPSVLPGTPYRLGKKIGEGASSVVHEAVHVELNRKVALKLLESAEASSLEAVARFRKEARAIAQLEHPNVAYLHDFGRTEDGRVFLAMELLEGETLASRLARREKANTPFSWREAAEMGLAATRALAAAHAAHLVHRDLKPENLFLTHDGTLKLLDFGIAIAKGDSAHDESPAKGFAIFGTPEYMAPEQVSGDPIDARSDLYALGCVLYELVTGSQPFTGASALSVMTKHVRDEARLPSHVRPERHVPAAFEAIVMRCMAKVPAERFADADALHAALQQLLDPPNKKNLRRPAFAVASALLALPLAVLAGMHTARSLESGTAELWPRAASNVVVSSAPIAPSPETAAEEGDEPRTTTPRVERPALAAAPERPIPSSAPHGVVAERRAPAAPRTPAATPRTVASSSPPRPAAPGSRTTPKPTLAKAPATSTPAIERAGLRTGGKKTAPR